MLLWWGLRDRKPGYPAERPEREFLQAGGIVRDR